MKHLKSINGVQMKRDAEGRINLNALYQAFVIKYPDKKTKDRQPGQWLRWQPTKDLVAELDGNKGPAPYSDGNWFTSKRRVGTFADPLIAYDYAQWLDPAFKVIVLKVFEGYVEKTLPTPPVPELPSMKPHEIEALCMGYLEQGRQINMLEHTVDALSNENTRQHEEIEQQVKIIKHKDEKIEAAKPAQSFYERMVASENVYTMSTASKLLKAECPDGTFVGRTKLFEYLREIGWICKTSREPTAMAIKAGYLTLHIGGNEDHKHPTSRVTGKGMVELHRRMIVANPQQSLDI